MTDHETLSALKRPWTKPLLESLGSMADVRANGARPPNDGSSSPSQAAS